MHGIAVTTFFKNMDVNRVTRYFFIIPIPMLFLVSMKSSASHKVGHFESFPAGYNDLGVRNGNLTHTPTINRLVAEGVTLGSYAITSTHPLCFSLIQN